MADTKERFEMNNDTSKPKKLSLSGSKLTLGNIDASKLRAGPSVGSARKTVQVEVRRKRAPAAPTRGSSTTQEVPITEKSPAKTKSSAATLPVVDDRLTAQERAARVRALKEGLAKTETPSESLVGNLGVDAAMGSGNDVPLTDEDSFLKSNNESRSETTIDPIAARRAAELAELLLF